jgi:fluoride exporter
MGQPEAEPKGKRVSDLLLAIVSHPIFLVGLGSAVGGVLRYYLGRFVDTGLGGPDFPWGTFAINVSGSFVLGVLALLINERLPPDFRWAYLLLGTGFCGGFTTFSTFEWETFQLVRGGSMWLALGNVFGSVLAGFAGVFLALLVVYGLLGRPTT